MTRERIINLPNRSRGIALLTVLLVVAIATITAVAMVSRQQVDIHKTDNLLRADQAWNYIIGIDAWAVSQLREDREANQTDSRHDDWNRPIPPTLVEGGEVSAVIEDLQGRFNLNNLVRNGSASPPDIIRFRRLLEMLDLNPNLADAVVDWIDSDSQVRFPGGAEDDLYSQKEPPYRAANSLFAHPSELLFVEGFDQETYETLKPHITALPEHVSINVNTATIPVLLALADGITPDNAQMLHLERESKPFTELDGFLAHQALAGVEIDASGLDVTSDYFQVNGLVRVGELQVRHASNIHRQMDGTIRVIQRSRKGLFDE